MRGQQLNGMRFSVNNGLDLWRQVGELENPKEMMDINPMVNTNTDSEGNVQNYYYKKSDGSQVTIQPDQVTRSNMRNKGIIFPPVHFRCRSWIDAVI